MSGIVNPLSGWSVPSTMLVTAQSSGGPDPTTGPITTTGANLIVAVVSHDLSCAQSLFRDSFSNTWTRATTQNAISGVSLDFWFVINPLVGTGHTFNPAISGCSGTTNYSYSSVIVQGVVQSTNVLFENYVSGASSAGVTTVQAGPLTPVRANEIIFSAAAMAISSGTWTTIDSGYTLLRGLGQQPNAYGVSLGYLIQSAPATTNPTWTYTPAGDTAAMSVDFYFPPTAGSAAGTGVSFSASAGTSFSGSAGASFTKGSGVRFS